jgi:CRP-like cAMP-binding protein
MYNDFIELSQLRSSKMALSIVPIDQINSEVNADLLKNGSVFGALSEEAIHFLLEQGEIYQVQAGDRVFEFGDKGDKFYVVCKGSIDFHKQHEGECVHTRTAGFGEELGFVAMISLHDHAGFAQASEDSIVLKISSVLFRQLHQQYPFDFGIMSLNLARDMARTIRKLSNTLVKNSIRY